MNLGVQIKVPRYSGTCTRCPLEISLSETPDQPWSCRISLRFKKQYDANRAGSGDPWVSRPGEIAQVPFVQLRDKARVESALSRAQTAILNPSKHWTLFSAPEGVPRPCGGALAAADAPARDGAAPAGSAQSGRRVRSAHGEDELEVKFSPNVVVMEISAPNVPNLSFIDLPGVIQTTETVRWPKLPAREVGIGLLTNGQDSEQYLIKLVQGLVEEYVTEPDCLILLAMTMKGCGLESAPPSFRICPSADLVVVVAVPV